MNHIKFLSFAFAAAIAVGSNGHAKQINYPIHVLPDEPGTSYEQLNQEYYENQSSQNLPIAPTSIDLMIKAGKQNLDWLKFMNEGRTDKLAFTKPGELTGYPIEKPSAYSPKTIDADYNGLIKDLPENMRKIIFEGAPFTKEPGQDIATYVKWGKKVDRAYQTASRWLLVSPSLYWYKMNKSNDVRGYYYLNKEENLAAKLANFKQNSADDQTRLGRLLVGICTNVIRDESSCQDNFKAALNQNSVTDFYNKYYSGAQALWNNFFALEEARSDFEWTNQNVNVMNVPFRSTEPKVEDYLRTNIEDEWKWNGWQLKLNFTPDAEVHVEFVPGSTPHVDGINGATITMDDNAPLTEWDVQWTIRHEFGHVVGFPDCYVEFYDSDAEQMVNYQLDTSNLMCSRMGKFKQIHFDEMRKKYLK